MNHRPLPRSLDPLPDESLPGFVLRLAHRLERTPARICEITGLTDAGKYKPPLGRRLYLDPATRTRFAEATQLHADEVAALDVAGLADRYAPLNAQFLGRTRRPESLAADPWIFGRAIRYCPTCLAGDGSPIQNEHGGAWQRRWHLPVVFACTTHQHLLTEHCPACRRPNHHDADQPVPSATVPALHPTQCRNRTASGQRRIPTVCGHRLDHTTPGTPPANPLLRIQERILRLLDRDQPDHATTFGQPATAAEYFTDVRLLASLVNITWPAAAPLLHEPVLREAVNRHVTSRRQTIAAMRASGKQPRSHAIFDRPPTDSLASAALLFLLDTIAAHATAADILTALLAQEAATPWTPHFFIAEPHCSAGLRAAIETAIRPKRRYPRPPAKPRKPRPPRRERRAAPFHPEKHKKSPKPSKRPKAPTKPQPAPALRPPRRKVHRALPPAPQYRFGPQHIPAFLTDIWFAEYLQHLDGIDPRLLRRATAGTLVSRAGNFSTHKAAIYLGLPPKATEYALRSLSRWRTSDVVNARAYDAALDSIVNHLETSDLINFRRRRHVMNHWTLSADQWQSITAHLRGVESAAHQRHTDYGERKRITASALAWIDITQGEHRFTPHRHSPGAKPGTTQDRGLSIDRAWWRLRNGKPGHHYWELRIALAPHIHDVAAAIDSGTMSAN